MGKTELPEEMVDDNDKDNVDDINNMDNGNDNNNDNDNMDNGNSNKHFFPKRSIIQCFFPKSQKNFRWAEEIFPNKRNEEAAQPVGLGFESWTREKNLKYSDHTVDMSLWGKANLKLV